MSLETQAPVGHGVWGYGVRGLGLGLGLGLGQAWA